MFWEICDEIEKDCHCLTFYVLSCFEQTKQLVKQLPCRKLVRSKFEKKDVLIDRYQDSKGRWRFKGNSALKGSQTYPAPFGREAFHGAVGSMKMCFFQSRWPSSIFQPCAGATAMGSLRSLPRDRVGRRSRRPMGRRRETWQPYGYIAIPSPKKMWFPYVGVQNQVEFPYIDSQNGFWTLLTVEGCRTVSALGGLSFWDIWKQNDSSNTFGAPNTQQWTEIQVILVVECWVPQGLNNLRVSQGSLGHLLLHYKGTP